MSHPRALVPSLAFVAVALVPAAASASGFETARMGGELGGVTASNPMALYYNPAGLAESTGTNIWGEYYLGLRGASYTHQNAPKTGTAPGDVGNDPSNVGKATLFNAVGAPALGFSTKLGDLALGAAFYVPFGGSETWDKNKTLASSTTNPGGVDGVQRWYTITGALQSLYWSAGAAYKIPGTGLSLGAAGNLIRSSIQLTRARAVDGTDSTALEGRALLDVSGFQGSFSGGAMFEALPKKLWFSASYQARPNVTGGMKLSGTLKTFLPPVGEVSTPVEVRQDLPDIIRAGVRFLPAPELELRLSGAYERWSAFTGQCISNAGQPCSVNADGSPSAGATPPLQYLPRNWNDTFTIHGGATYQVNDAVELFGGVGFDSAAMSLAHLEPDLMDMANVDVGAGARFALGSHLHAAASYTQFIYLDADSTGQSINPTLKPPSNWPDAGGKYSQWIGVINVHLEASL